MTFPAHGRTHPDTLARYTWDIFCKLTENSRFVTFFDKKNAI